MVIRVDKENYFVDSDTKDRLEEYDPFNGNLEFRFRTDLGALYVHSDKIRVTSLGICFEYNGNTYIIDDGHQYKLNFAAYITNKNPENSIEIRKEIFSRIKEALNSEFTESNFYIDDIVTRSNNVICSFRSSESEGKITFQTISNLVNTNKTRREYDLPYYPYIRGMDKYNSYYMSIWSNKPVSGSEFLNELIEKLNNEEMEFDQTQVLISTHIIRVRDDLLPS
jgi:hypothetical protein